MEAGVFIATHSGPSCAGLGQRRLSRGNWLLAGLTSLRVLKMDSCKALHPKGSDHFRFLAGMPGLTELNWAAHAGKPDWIEPDASVAGAEIGAMCLLMHAHKLTNLQRCRYNSSRQVIPYLCLHPWKVQCPPYSSYLSY